MCVIQPEFVLTSSTFVNQERSGKKMKDESESAKTEIPGETGMRPLKRTEIIAIWVKVDPDKLERLLHLPPS